MKSSKTRFDGEPPRDPRTGKVIPHIIVCHRPGAWLAVPPGSLVGIVENPTVGSPFHNMAVQSVTESKIIFKCLCNPTCQVTHEFRRIATKGLHAR